MQPDNSEKRRILDNSDQRRILDNPEQRRVLDNSEQRRILVNPEQRRILDNSEQRRIMQAELTRNPDISERNRIRLSDQSNYGRSVEHGEMLRAPELSGRAPEGRNESLAENRSLPENTLLERREGGREERREERRERVGQPPHPLLESELLENLTLSRGEAPVPMDLDYDKDSMKRSVHSILEHDRSMNLGLGDRYTDLEDHRAEALRHPGVQPGGQGKGQPRQDRATSEGSSGYPSSGYPAYEQEHRDHTQQW